MMEFGEEASKLSHGILYKSKSVSLLCAYESADTQFLINLPLNLFNSEKKRFFHACLWID